MQSILTFTYRPFRLHPLLLLLIVSTPAAGQGGGYAQQFRELSRPEKIWVAFHPFSAKKALAISMDALHVTDSLNKAGLLDGDMQGGLSDAFKHAFWMAQLAKNIGWRKAWRLGKAHERGNYLSYKKGARKGLTGLQDKESSEMDFRNNLVGLEIGKKRKHKTRKEIIRETLQKMEEGEMTIIRKDSSGRYLDCKGKFLEIPSGKRGWESGKCLAPSNSYIF